jgi:hypothetical protein
MIVFRHLGQHLLVLLKNCLRAGHPLFLFSVRVSSEPVLASFRDRVLQQMRTAAAKYSLLECVTFLVRL